MQRLTTIALFLSSTAVPAAHGLPQGPLPSDSGSNGEVASRLDPWKEFARVARERHGDTGAVAAAFLRAHRPERDTTIDAELLVENLDLAIAARGRFPWAAAIPDELFLNDVLPYASLDETRERWRPELLAIAAPIVAECKTAAEAAQALNRELFNAVDVHYNTGRKKPNQSPAESVAQKRATCTGLSILLIDACRAVGVPARAAGVASWHDKRGNHTWVEVWDGSWHFTGADEYDAAGLDRGWFRDDAAKAVPGDPRFAVWATSWARTGAHFPMVWNRRDRSVPAVDVTARYLPSDAAPARVLAARNVRVWNRAGGERIAAVVRAVDPDGTVHADVTTRAGRADLNDMPTLSLVPGLYRLEVEIEGETRSLPLDVNEAGAETLEIDWSALGVAASGSLTKESAEGLVASLWDEMTATLREKRADELAKKAIVDGQHQLRVLEKTFGDAPAGERSLWISMHGGGGAPGRVNDKQWQNQIRLYEPAEGIYVAPRAPTDTWNLWHQAHIDGLFDRLIESYVTARGVDPDRVYLMGYSAGGDGVYQLAPRMADRFAAASMMAGHPNEAQPLALRNLPFAIFMGGKDGAYDRNAVAERWGRQLGELRERDPEGYPHRVTIYPECGHWMEGQDREALPWMASKVRNPWPSEVVWFQDDVTHTRFYWLSVAPSDAVAGRTIRARAHGQTITIESEVTRAVTLRLRDGLVDLDEPVTVIVGDETVYDGSVPRTRSAIEQSLLERADPRTAATALLSVQW